MGKDSPASESSPWSTFRGVTRRSYVPSPNQRYFKNHVLHLCSTQFINYLHHFLGDKKNPSVSNLKPSQNEIEIPFFLGTAFPGHGRRMGLSFLPLLKDYMNLRKRKLILGAKSKALERRTKTCLEDLPTWEMMSFIS